MADEAIEVGRGVRRGGWRSTVAGMGMMGGFSGDNGPATSAKLSAPTGVAVTADGGFLIGEVGNDVVRRVSPGGTIPTGRGTATRGERRGRGRPRRRRHARRPVRA